jgi:hypothetical protein
MTLRKDTSWNPTRPALSAVGFLGDTANLYFFDGVKWARVKVGVDSFYYGVRQFDSVTVLYDRSDGVVDTLVFDGNGGGGGGGGVHIIGVDTIYRKPGQDSIFYKIAGGTERAVKDSVGVTSVNNIGNQPNTFGATINGNILTLQPASNSFGGVVNTSTQTFGGQKTFANTVTVQQNLQFTRPSSAVTSITFGPTFSTLPNPVFTMVHDGNSRRFSFISGTGQHRLNHITILDEGMGHPSYFGQTEPYIFNIESNSRGFLPPRLNNAQMGNVINPIAGLQLYNTQARMLMVHDGTAFKTGGVVSGSYSATGNSTSTVTVTFGGTQPNTEYNVNITPTGSAGVSLVASAGFFVENKTNTTFNVTFLTPITGQISFDYIITR